MNYQVSVFLENKTGHLEKVTAVLRAAQINIRSMHLNHTANGWGILNLVVSDPQLAHRLLNESGMTAALREIVLVQMADNPGGLDELLQEIVAAGVNFTNAYGIVESNGGHAFFVIDIQGLPDAKKMLGNSGLNILENAWI